MLDNDSNETETADAKCDQKGNEESVDQNGASTANDEQDESDPVFELTVHGNTGGDAVYPELGEAQWDIHEYLNDRTAESSTPTQHIGHARTNHKRTYAEVIP